MNTSIVSRTLRTVVATTAFAWSGVVLAAAGSFEQTIPGDDITSIDVETRSGLVIVKGEDVADVKIRAVITVNKRYANRDPVRTGRIVSAIKRSPPIEVNDGRLVISESSRSSHKRYVNINYEIVVPRQSTINVHSESGDVRVTGVDGPVNAVSDTGTVTVADSSAARDARSGG